MELGEYVNGREKVVLWWRSVGTPAGDYVPMGCPDIDFAGRNDLLGLTGTLDGRGDWRWDGVGNPTDDLRNTVTSLHAYVDTEGWDALVREYEEG